MRKLFVYILAALTLAGCEVIREEDRLIPVETRTSVRRHVLLEFTGFRCVNCPTAAELAQSLEQTYEGQLYTVSLHPASNPFTQGAYDYTCPEADSVYLWMGGTATTPFPAGNVNMRRLGDDSFADMSQWATMVYDAMQDTVAPYIRCVSAVANTTQRQVDVLIEHVPSIEAHMACWLIEDSVAGVQAMPDGTVNTQYFHRHVLRAAWNHQPFGEPTNGQASERHISVDLPEGCDPRHCSVIAMLLDKNDFHILNAHETTLDFRTDY